MTLSGFVRARALAHPALSLDQAAAAFIVAAAAAAAAAVLLAAFVRSVHGAVVSRGDALDEVAVAVVIEHGAKGRYSMQVAKDLLDGYFK